MTQKVCWHGRVKVRVGSCYWVVGRGRKRLVRLLLLPLQRRCLLLQLPLMGLNAAQAIYSVRFIVWRNLVMDVMRMIAR